MPEQEKDQVTVEKPEQSGEGYKLPERGFFQGDEMAKFAEQMELVVKPAPTPAKKEVPCPEGAPCGEAKKAMPPEERKPYKVLKVRGKDFPVYSEDELVEFAQKGTHYTQERQKDSEWEKELAAREDRLERLSPHIERVVEFLDSGGELPGTRAPKREEAPIEEEILDPIAAERIKRFEERLGTLENENKYLKSRAQEDNLGRAQRELTETFNSVTKETPFEQVLDEDNRNISQEIFAGLIALKANKDALRMKSERGFKMKTMAEYMTDTAKDMSRLEKYFRGNGTGEVSAEIVKTKFPKVAETLGQEAIDAYLQRLEEQGSPVVRPTKTEPSVRPQKREIKNISDALEQGLADPEVMEGLADFGRKFRISNT